MNFIVIGTMARAISAAIFNVHSDDFIIFITKREIRWRPVEASSNEEGPKPSETMEIVKYDRNYKVGCELKLRAIIKSNKYLFSYGRSESKLSFTFQFWPSFEASIAATHGYKTTCLPILMHIIASFDFVRIPTCDCLFVQL